MDDLDLRRCGTLAFDLLFVGTGGAGTPEVPVPVAAAGPPDLTEEWAPAPNDTS